MACDTRGMSSALVIGMKLRGLEDEFEFSLMAGQTLVRFLLNIIYHRHYDYLSPFNSTRLLPTFHSFLTYVHMKKATRTTGDNIGQTRGTPLKRNPRKSPDFAHELLVQNWDFPRSEHFAPQIHAHRFKLF